MGPACRFLASSPILHPARSSPTEPTTATAFTVDAILAGRNILLQPREQPMISHDSDKMGEFHRELHSVLPSEPALRVKAFESALVAKGLLAPDAVDKWLENYSEKIGPKNGALVIARSWLEPEFRGLLEQDALRAFEQMGFAGSS